MPWNLEALTTVTAYTITPIGPGLGAALQGCRGYRGGPRSLDSAPPPLAPPPTRRANERAWRAAVTDTRVTAHAMSCDYDCVPCCLTCCHVDGIVASTHTSLHRTTSVPQQCPTSHTRSLALFLYPGSQAAFLPSRLPDLQVIITRPPEYRSAPGLARIKRFALRIKPAPCPRSPRPPLPTRWRPAPLPLPAQTSAPAPAARACSGSRPPDP